MKKVILFGLFLFVTVCVFSLGMDSEREQYQFTYFPGLEDMKETVKVGLLFYPQELEVSMYIKDYHESAEKETNIIAVGEFTIDDQLGIMHVKLVDSEYSVIEISLRIATEYVMVGEIFSNGVIDEVVLVDRHYILNSDKIHEIVLSSKRK